MTEPESVAAWRLFTFNWLPIAAMSLLLAIAMVVFGFTFAPAGLLVCALFVAIYTGFAYYNAWSPYRRDPQVVFVLGATAQVVLVTLVMTPMTYIAAALNQPMQDAALLAADRAFGLDWLAYVQFVNAHPMLAEWLSFGYGMIRWPVFAIPVLLAATRHYRRMQTFTLAFLLALIVTTIISALVPAIGVFQQLGLNVTDFTNLHPGAYLQQLRDLPLVREGTLRALDLISLGGIVTFPSFHAASAVLYTWALWSVRWMRPVTILSNGMMFIATPIDGGHYFIDLAAGVAVAIGAVWAAKSLAAAMLHEQQAPTIAIVVPAE